MPKGIYKRTEIAKKNISEVRLERKKRLGYINSLETREKMSKTHKGKHHSPKTEFKKGFIPWMKGRRHTEETKKKISKSRTGKRKGSSCNFWKDGRCKNKEYIRWLKNKRNRLKRAKEGSHTFGEWELLKKQYGYTCPCCGKKEPEIKLTQDHIIPLSRGGSDYIENIQPLCKSCNCKKHTKIIKYEI